MINKEKIFQQYIQPLGIIVILCLVGHHYCEKCLDYIKFITTVGSVYTLVLAIKTADKLAKHKHKICQNIADSNTIQTLKDITSKLERNYEHPELLYSSIRDDIIKYIKEIFAQDEALQSTYKQKLDYIESQKKINVSNIRTICKEVTDIYQSAERIHE